MFKKKKPEEKLTAEEAVEILKEKTEKQEIEMAKLKAQLAKKGEVVEEVEEQEEQPVQKKVAEDLYVISEVATQHAPIIVNSKNPEEGYSELTAICKLMNDVVELKEAIVGK